MRTFYFVAVISIFFVLLFSSPISAVADWMSTREPERRETEKRETERRETERRETLPGQEKRETEKREIFHS